jgi:hypothetical protein
MSDAVASPTRVRASATPAALQLGQGQQAFVIVTVENRAPVVDQFALVVEGLGAEFFDVRLDHVSLFPGEAGELTLEVRLPADQFVPAGSRIVTLRVVSRYDPLVEAVIRLPLEVETVQRMSLELRPAQVSTRSVGRFHAYVSNLGNAEQVLDLAIGDPQAGLHTWLSRDRLAVAPGEVADVEIRLRPRRRPLHGFAQYYPFGVVLGAPDAAADALPTASGVLVYRPPLGWLGATLAHARTALLGLLVLLVALAIIIWMLGAPGERPADQPVVAQAPDISEAVPSAAADNASGALGVAAATSAQAGPGQGTAAVGGPGQGTAAVGGPSGISLGGTASAPPAPLVPLAPISPPPVIVSFDVSSPPDGAAPGLLQLSWEVRNVEQVTVGGAALPAVGSAFVQGLQEGEVELVARNAAGEARRSVGLLVLHPPEIVEFSATPPTVDSGQLVTLAWRVSRAETLRIFGPDLDPVGEVVDPILGTLQVRPVRAATYTLRADNALGRAQEALPVAVSGAPTSPTPQPAATAAPTPATPIR